MAEDQAPLPPTLALNTQVETDFVSPLTAVRGALEILRDFEDLSQDDHRRFVETALRACQQLEAGVENLAASVYAAGVEDETCRPAHVSDTDYAFYANRVAILEDEGAVEIDFSDFVFSSTKIVNDFFDSIEGIVEQTGRSWFFLVNSRGCRVWPEAWVAYAHRGKKINTIYSDGTVRYATHKSGEQAQTRRPDSLAPYYADSRDSALDMVRDMRNKAG